MKPQYDHNVITSFMLWLDNKFTNEGQAYVNTTGLLYKGKDSSVQGHIYASPYRGWVYDNCASGAAIPSGFYDSQGNFLTRASGIVIDFVNGRVISNQDRGNVLSGVYARKEINLYFSSDEENEYILEQVYGENKNLTYTLTGFNGRALQAPLAMVTNAGGYNKPWALGGMDNSKSTVRVFAITNTNYLQEGINSICRDVADQYIPFANYSSAPLNASGDLKNPNWSYCVDIKDVFGCKNGLYVDDVYFFKLNEKNNKNNTFFLSSMEFDISKPRVPHLG